MIQEYVVYDVCLPHLVVSESGTLETLHALGRITDRYCMTWVRGVTE